MNTPATQPSKGGCLKFVLAVGAIALLLGAAIAAFDRFSGAATERDAARAAALVALKAQNPSAAEIVWSGPASLWVYMPPDGSPRDGLAEAYCEQLKPLGVGGVTVRIQSSMARRDSAPETIGKASCR